MSFITFERGSPMDFTAIDTTGISAGSQFDGDTGDPAALGWGDWPV